MNVVDDRPITLAEACALFGGLHAVHVARRGRARPA